MNARAPRPAPPWPMCLQDDSLFEKEPLHFSPTEPTTPKFSPISGDATYDAWLSSRYSRGCQEAPLAAGGHRPLNRANIGLAYVICKECAWDLFQLLWSLHPVRAAVMVALNLARGLFPAFKGYSQALIINELQSLLSSDHWTWSRLARLLVGELSRMALESVLDTFAQTNENIVNGSARFIVEYQQMHQRSRLDLPALVDPVVRDLLQESDTFARSFTGMGGFGLISPLDFVRILTLLSEVFAHVFILLSLTRSSTHLCILALSLVSSLLPLVDVAAWLGVRRQGHDDVYSPAEARAMAKQEQMRNLVYNESYRSEILVFGLSSWILESWASARRTMLGIEQSQPAMNLRHIVSTLVTQINLAEMLALLHNIPLFLFLQSSSSSLGSVALYRNSIFSLIFAASSLVHTLRMAFQGVFLAGAFCAAMDIEPRLQPKTSSQVSYKPSPQGGMKIEARNLSFTYPGCIEPALKNLSFTIEAGETLAVVGYNGSGKSTLANILLRLQDFDSGELLINGVDIRRYDPAELHTRLTAVLQGFARFHTTVKENVGVGYIDDLGAHTAVQRAVHLAGADDIVRALPRGLATKLDGHAGTFGFAPPPCPRVPGAPASPTDDHWVHHGLSGGEWQRVAISRAFMRAHRPEVDLMVFDEPTSALDAHAQNNVFDTIDKISRAPSGEKSKTVIFITHRLATARRADKVLMMDKGTVSEFGSHDELLTRNGPYASLYRASI